jgi:sigma-B regulation protein RsbQ
MSTLPFIPLQQLAPDAHALALLQRHNVHVVGTGKPPLLFCNGFNCGQRVWNYLAPSLAAHYQLILFDQMGVGESDRTVPVPSRYATLDGYVQDVVDICQALHLQDVVIIGHSAGAIISILAAIRAPQCFSKAILIAASPHYLNEPDYYGGFERSDLLALLAEMNKNYQQWANTFSTMMIGQYYAPALSSELIDCASKADPELAKRMVEMTFLGDYRADLPKLQIPTLLLQCAEDAAVPTEVSHYMLAHLPQATLGNLQATGHCPHLTAPAEVLAAMQRFLS